MLKITAPAIGSLEIFLSLGMGLLVSVFGKIRGVSLFVLLLLFALLPSLLPKGKNSLSENPTLLSPLSVGIPPNTKNNPTAITTNIPTTNNIILLILFY
jgi:hypothetical protein